MLKTLRATSLLIGLLALNACSNLTPVQEKTMVGGAAGVAAGTVGTIVLGGCVPCGAALGGAVGAGAGYAVEKVSEMTR